MLPGSAGNAELVQWQHPKPPCTHVSLEQSSLLHVYFPAVNYDSIFVMYCILARVHGSNVSGSTVRYVFYRAFSCDVITFEITKENRKQPPCWCTTR